MIHGDTVNVETVENGPTPDPAQNQMENQHNESNRSDPDSSTSAIFDIAENCTMTRSLRRRIMEAVFAILVRVVSHFWRACTAGGLMLVITWWIYGGWLFCFLFALSIMGLLYHCQDLLLYYPDQPPTARMYVDLPSSFKLPYEEHFIKTEDGISLNAVFLKQTTSAACQTILYLHGNAGNIGNRLMNAHGLYTYCGCNVLLLEYRGYGKSDGSPCETGLYKDAVAAMHFLLKRTDIDLTQILIFGRSLGGAVAIYLATHPIFSKHIAGLIVENTFTSIRDIAAVIFRTKAITYVPQLIIKNKYPSIQRIAQVRKPTLFLSGLSDNLIPPHMMTTLYQKCGARLKRMFTFEMGGHNDTWTCNNYYPHMYTFLTQLKVLHHSNRDYTNTSNICTV